MPFTQEFLLLASIPLAVPLSLLVGHLVTLRGLRGSHRVTAFRAFADAMKIRR
ncbi:hypothetical protein ACIRU8_34320 [Streptomyces sp. NPDC101175]|uniref:hypothetical protein n=1 Tax=Streptomyces sp. NPDC101175 TaxID=3366123 RepID=UPI00383684FD